MTKHTTDTLRAMLSLATGSGMADGVEAMLVNEDLQELRLANNAVIQTQEYSATTLTLRVIVNGVAAVSSTNLLTRESILATVERAAQLARATGIQGDYPPLSSEDLPAPGSLPQSVCEATLHRTTEEHMAALVPALKLSRANDTVLAGHSRSGLRRVLFMSSAGRFRSHDTTLYDTMLIATGEGRVSGYAGDSGTSLVNADPIESLGRRAVEDALLGRNPLALPPGKYDVILQPEAVAELLEWLTGIGFTSGAYEDGLSFIRGKEGEKVTGSEVTIYDDGWCESGVGIPLPFDSQGEWKTRTRFIESGIARGIAHDRQSAARMNCMSTGHATLSDDMPEGSSRPEHVVMGAGSDSPEDLLGKVDRGLWISRFHYVNGLLEPKRAVMTGLTRDGCFLVENGKRVRGVKTLRFTDSVLEAFERIAGISKHQRVVPTWWSEGGAFVTPTIVLRDFQFTGQSGE